MRSRSRAITAAERVCTAMTIMLLRPPAAQDAARDTPRRARMRSDRGDVPGWVMITVMTAIVVLALLTVFQEAVLSAVSNAFDSITGAG